MSCQWAKPTPPLLVLLPSACVAVNQGSRHCWGAQFHSHSNNDCIFIQRETLSSEAPRIYGTELQPSHDLETSEAVKLWTPWWEHQHRKYILWKIRVILSQKLPVESPIIDVSFSCSHSKVYCECWNPVLLSVLMLSVRQLQKGNFRLCLLLSMWTEY